MGLRFSFFFYIVLNITGKLVSLIHLASELELLYGTMYGNNHAKRHAPYLATS